MPGTVKGGRSPMMLFRAGNRDRAGEECSRGPAVPSSVSDRASVSFPAWRFLSLHPVLGLVPERVHFLER